MIFRLALVLVLPGCVAAVPAAPYIAGAASSVAAAYVGDATFDYAGRRVRVQEMTCPQLQVAYAHTPPSQSRLVNRYTDWLTTRGMMEDHAQDLDCPLALPDAQAALEPT
jgi:hypothetical protein